MNNSIKQIVCGSTLAMSIFASCVKFDSLPQGLVVGTNAYGVGVYQQQHIVYFNDTDSVEAAIALANAEGYPVYVQQGAHNALVKTVPAHGFLGNGSISYRNTVIYRPDWDFVGIPHNLEEQTYQYPTLLNSGQIIEAPLATPTPDRSVDILASFYNDFGLQRTALSPTSAYGWYGWYDWRWNFTTHANYDPARHPIFGWYRGDDANVLDWTCYWLVKHGVKGVVLTGRVGTSNWQDPADYSHWVYQLFNHSKNFNSLKYALFLSAVTHQIPREEAVLNDFDVADNIVANHDNVYCYEQDGKRYPVLYMWNRESFRGSHDNYNGYSNSVSHLVNLAARYKSHGFDGICVYVNGLVPGSWPVLASPTLLTNDVLLFSQGYSTGYLPGGSFTGTYANYANNTVFPADSATILNVMTSAHTQLPHNSGWNLTGSTPALFATALQRAVDQTKLSNKPKTVVVYNVSEWAEGGPGLIPNQQDGYGYLEAIRDINY